MTSVYSTWDNEFGATSERIGFDFVDNYEFVNGEVTTSGQSNDVEKNILYLYTQKLAKDSTVVYRSVRKLTCEPIIDTFV